MSVSASDPMALVGADESIAVLSRTGVVHRRGSGPSAACGLADDVVILGATKARKMGIRACRRVDCFGDGEVLDRRAPYEGVDMDRFTLRVPTPLLRSVDAAVEAGEYPNRSEAMRSALRKYFGVTGGQR